MLAVALTAVNLAAASNARADPQASLGLTTGWDFRDAAGSRSEHGGMHLGARADVLFLRTRGRDMAVGPYLDFATAAFDDFDAGGGVEWLVPTRDELPFVFSAGALARNGATPGAAATVFFGSRSFNFHSWYGIAAGLFVQGRWLPALSTADVIAGLQLDAELVALPWLLLYEAVAH